MIWNALGRWLFDVFLGCFLADLTYLEWFGLLYGNLLPIQFGSLVAWLFFGSGGFNQPGLEDGCIDWGVQESKRGRSPMDMLD